MRRIKLVASGDSFITMRVSIYSEPRFLELVELIRGADVAFTNLEVLLHDYEEDVFPAAECGGTYTRADPSLIEDLKWMGFDIVSTANNHSLDYSYGGLFKTIEHLDRAGIPHAGTGRDLAEARQPTYLETGRGRVALIAAASTYPSFGRAGSARRDLHGRPGLNPLRFERYYVTRERTIEVLRRVAEELGLEEVYHPEGCYYFLRNKFVIGEDVGVHTKPNESDVEGNLEVVKEAVRQADWVLFSLHAHEGREGDPERPAEFIEEFARACIDAGVHAFIGHGPHIMRGIEIRDGRPIFYSLGNFIFQNETVLKMPADFYERYKLDPHRGTPADAYDARQKAPPRPGYPIRKWFTEEEKYWLSVVPVMTFRDNRLEELSLYPIDLGWGKPRTERGLPILADPQLAEKILNKLRELSKPYGTEITLGEGVGTVAL